MLDVRRLKILVILATFLVTGQSLWTQEIPEFDGERSFSYLEDQCDFGPRNPGSVGHSDCLKTSSSRAANPVPHGFVNFTFREINVS